MHNFRINGIVATSEHWHQVIITLLLDKIRSPENKSKKRKKTINPKSKKQIINAPKVKSREEKQTDLYESWTKILAGSRAETGSQCKDKTQEAEIYRVGQKVTKEQNITKTTGKPKKQHKRRHTNSKINVFVESVLRVQLFTQIILLNTHLHID